MATKPFVTVALKLHGIDGSFSFADYLNDNGEFINIGTQAAAAIARREAIHLYDENAGDNGAEVVIPFHAISIALTAKESGEYTKPEDNFCQQIESGCTGTFTVTWVGEGIEETTETYACGVKPTYKGEYPLDCSTPQWINDTHYYQPDNLPPVTEDVTYALDCGK